VTIALPPTISFGYLPILAGIKLVNLSYSIRNAGGISLRTDSPIALLLPMTQTIQSIGELGLLQLVQRFCPADIVGDDAAVLAMLPDRSLVVTTDVLVDGVHFSDRTTPPHSAGWRAIAANLSDLAAMGAMPIGVTVGLGLPGETPVDWVEELYRGMADCLAAYGGDIVGGDLVRSPVRTVSITAFGQVEPDRVMRRSGAKVGDVIVVTGDHGRSRAGLEQLLKPELGHDAGLIQAHQYPVPQLAIGHQIRNFATACMDSSDGLADAVLQLCRASQVGADITTLPIPQALVNHPQAKDWTLYGGEDFELVVCLGADAALRMMQEFPQIQIVGQITSGSITSGRSQTIVQLSDPRFAPETLSRDRGFQHF
jgi:thiamine-monophosphate kinase